MPVPEIPLEWRSATWWRACVRLRFTGRPPNGYEEKQNEGSGPFHPCFVFQGIFYDATAEDKNADWKRPVFTWHPLNKLFPSRFQRTGEEHHLALIFPSTTGIETWRRMKEYWSRTPVPNFEIIETTPCEERSLSVLEKEHPSPAAELEENASIQLHFSTPWTFNAPDPRRTWQPGILNLGRALANAVCPFLGSPNLQDASWPPDTHLSAIYWHLLKLVHRSASQSGKKNMPSGLRGPLFLTAPACDLRLWWPWLLLGSEFHIGSNRTLGFGRFLPSQPQPVLDTLLGGQHLYSTWRALEEKLDRTLGVLPLSEPGGERKAIHALAEVLHLRQWQAQPATFSTLSKATARAQPEVIEDTPYPVAIEPPPPPSTQDSSLILPALSLQSDRFIAHFAEADRLVHKAIASLLEKPSEGLLSEAVHGYRRGRSKDSAIRQAREFLRQGLHSIAQLDVASFYDEIPWCRLMEKLRRALPAPDEAILHAITQIVQTPVTYYGKILSRTCGILQGSSLSPLLSNLYLTDFDHSLTAAGFAHLRYGDDVAIFCSAREDAERGLALATRLLAKDGLRVKEEKTALHDASEATFRYLGTELGGPEGPPSPPDDAPLRRPVYLSRPHQWAGSETGALLLREGRHLVERLPLTHVSELTLCGLGGLSSRLVEECLQRRIPLTLCQGLGQHLATLQPDPRIALDTLITHHQRFTALEPEELVRAAREIVSAKIAAYQAWFSSLPYTEVKSLQRKLRFIQEKLPTFHSVDSLRGCEGEAARLTFPFVNARLKPPFFRSTRRAPREKADAWNVLLDTGYFLLYQRLHTLLRTCSLHPYLGFLHSAANTYPSLVCDLQEAHRARVDQLLTRLVNLQQIKEADFEQRPDQRWRLSSDGARRLIKEFETELDRHHYGERYNWRTQLSRQVEMHRQWVRERVRLWFYAPQVLPRPSKVGTQAEAGHESPSKPEQCLDEDLTFGEPP